MEEKGNPSSAKRSATMDDNYATSSLNGHVLECSASDGPLSGSSMGSHNNSIPLEKQGVIIMNHDPNASTVMESHSVVLNDNVNKVKINIGGQNTSSHQHTTFGETDPGDSNYFVFVESSDGSQVIPRVIPSILQSNREDSQLSLNTVLHSDISYIDSNTLNQGKEQAEFTTESVTMVLDTGLQRGESQKVFIEPSSFLSISDQSISPMQLAIIEKNSKMTFDDSLPGKNVIIHPDVSSLPQNGQSVQVSSQMEDHTTNSQIRLIPVSTYNWDSKNKDAVESTINPSLNQDFISVQKEVEMQFKEQQRQMNLRLLEQSHLEHQEQLLQRRNRKGNEGNADLGGDCTEQMLKEVGIDDDTPIFSHISAQINPEILLHVPGCQKILLNEAAEKPSTSQITFSSELDCSFAGDIKNFVSLHTLIKSLIRLCSPTNLIFEKSKDRGKKENKNVSCNLLVPYVSSKGRISKQSYKLTQMGVQTKLDDSVSDEDVSDNKKYLKKQKRAYKRRRMISRNKYKHSLQDSFSDYLNQNNSKQEDNLNEVVSVISPEESSQSLPKQFEKQLNDVRLEKLDLLEDPMIDESVEEVHNLHSSLPDLTDPVQKRLLEEQIKCKQIYEANSKLRQLKAVMAAHRKEEIQGTDKCLSDTATATDNINNPLPCDIRPRRCRGRPPKKFDPSEIVGRVKPRNPLTESAETKQRRAYEESVAFKFFCDQCSFKTKRQSQYDIHLNYHQKGKGIKHYCRHCDFVTISVPAMKQHELLHKRNVLRCELCNVYVTDKKYLLQKHMRLKHHPKGTTGKDKKFSCHQCAATFTNRIARGRHEAMHLKLLIGQATENTAANTCPQCKRSFGKKIHLHRHIRDVHGPQLRPHLCDKCGQSFKRKDALQQHRIVHIAKSARVLPFKCNKCDKAFRSQAHLKEHSSIHSTDRPYLCQYCGASFKTQPVQKKHILTLHIQPRTHVCSVCFRQFNTKNALQRHENTHKTTNEQAEVDEAIRPWDTQVIDTGMKKIEIKENHNTGDLEVSSNVMVSLEEDQATTTLVVKTDNGAQVIVDPSLVPVMMSPTEGHSSTNTRNLEVQQALIQGGQTDQTFYYLSDDQLQNIQ